MKYFFPATLLVISMVFIIYPHADETIQNHKEQKLISKFNNMYLQAATNDEEIAFTNVDAFKEIDDVLASGLIQEEDEIASDSRPPIELAGGAKALIEIDKIDLKIPVLEGATEENMKFSAAHIEGTSEFGTIGNVGIAAHRARTKGRLFNRLDELEVGDLIHVTIPEKDLQYKVINVRLVLPVQVSVLNRNNLDSLMTLITCHPIENATHRLIVQAELVQ